MKRWNKKHASLIIKREGLRRRWRRERRGKSKRRREIGQTDQ